MQKNVESTKGRMRSGSFILSYRHFLVFILVSYAVVFSPFVDASLRNYLTLAAALIGGLLLFRPNVFVGLDAALAFFLFVMMSATVLFLEGTAGLQSVALTLIYALGYFAVSGLSKRVKNKRDTVIKVMQGIIYAFAALSLVQLVTSFAGLPVPNLMSTKGLWSYNSLAYEPSQLGRVVGISMLCYILLAKQSGANAMFHSNPKLHIAFLATMLLSGSALAALAILLVYIFSRSLTWVAVIAAVSVLIWPMFLIIDFEPLRRTVLLVSELGTLDIDQVLAADHSGGIRVAPILIYLKEASSADPGFWFGYGREGLDHFFQGRIAGVSDDTTFAGFIPGFTVVYGVLASAFFIWIFVLRQANRITLPLICFWAILMTSSAWNSQVFWYGLIVIQVALAASRDIPQSSRRAPV